MVFRNKVKPRRMVHRGRASSKKGDRSHLWLSIPLISLLSIIIYILFVVNNLNVLLISLFLFIGLLIAFLLGENFESKILIDIQFIISCLASIGISISLVDYYDIENKEIILLIGVAAPFLTFISIILQIEFKLHFKSKLLTPISRFGSSFIKVFHSLLIQPIKSLVIGIRKRLKDRSLIRKKLLLLQSIMS